MRVKTQCDTIPIGKGKLKFHLLKTSLIHLISHERKMINQLRMTDADDMLANIYLRVKKPHSYVFKKVIGDSSCRYNEEQIVYEGQFDKLQYRILVDVKDSMWFINVFIKGCEEDEVDVFYLQDIGIKDANAIRNNEAYNSQYIDHKVFQHGHSHAICSLQNGGQKEYLQIGALTPTKGYATDGYQFFGLSYKATNIPEAMMMDVLPNEIYQYEFACATLQSESFHVNDMHEHHVVFYGLFVENHVSAIKELEYIEDIKTVYHSLDRLPRETKPIDVDSNRFRLNQLFTSNPFTANQIEVLYPNRYFEEFKEGKLLSFFTEHHEHVVLQEKELYSERAHGHIILNGKNHTLREAVMASTSFIFGVFNSQIVLGNTSFSKLVSNTRNGLNVQRANGQRILIKVDGVYQLLGLPAAYEMGFNYAKWLYQAHEDIIEVRSYTLIDAEELNVEVISHQQKSYDWIILSQIIMGPDELAHDYDVVWDKADVTIKAVPESFISTQYPGIQYRISLIEGDFHVESLNTKNPYVEQGLLKMSLKGSVIKLNIKGSLQEMDQPKVSSFDQEVNSFRTYVNRLINQFHLDIPIDHPRFREVSKLNVTLYWYTHNALIHFASPHGLEQFGGAAWGTRDVCQGPFEFFLSLGKNEEARNILLSVFKHQFEQNGDWPQWFMFDKFFRIQAKESHGDIIVWPLRSVALYLKTTQDYSLLYERLPYTDLSSSLLTSEDTLLAHLLKAIEHIKANYISDTYLSSYGDGDWDDTLQPANSSLRKQMVSGWTTALTFETFTMLSEVLQTVEPTVAQELAFQAEHIKKDYMTYIVKDDIPAGFLYFGDHKEIKYIIHPLDQETKMTYRLLPMNRGIIAELFDQPLANHLYQTIKENLYHPDGVRLMNTTVPYNGGENTYFKRAETSANFGREIGLQYVHAHIRFIEAMAKLGKKEEAWLGLQKINPIAIKDIVPNAIERQANAYFSSSDGAFLNRYEAMKDFKKLFTGGIGVKGGWRVYSSGPGIYINQVISHVLGIRFEGDTLLIDPQLPHDLDGLSLIYNIKGQPTKIIFHLGQPKRKVLINGKMIETEIVSSRYREGALKLHLSNLIQEGTCTLEYFG